MEEKQSRKVRPPRSKEMLEHAFTITVQEVQDYTGLSRNMIFKLIKEGKLDSAAISGRRLVFSAKLEYMMPQMQEADKSRRRRRKQKSDAAA